jgi:RHS repeat-associated protein
LAQAVVTSTRVTTPYTDTYLYTQDGAPLELLRQQNGTTCRYWYVLDGRGNVVALTDSTGNVVDRYSYDVWGALTSVSESVPQRLRYAGYWYDQELGWYWVSVRLYDPSLKRWLQPDPSEAEGVHTYVYVGDDPIDATDPQGLGGLCNVPLVGGVSCGLGALAHGACGTMWAMQRCTRSPWRMNTPSSSAPHVFWCIMPTGALAWKARLRI